LRGRSRLYRSAQRSEPDVRLSASADRRRFAVALTPATPYDRYYCYYYYYCNRIFAIPHKNPPFYAATARIDVILERILNVYSTTLSIFTRSSKETLCFALIAILVFPTARPFAKIAAFNLRRPRSRKSEVPEEEAVEAEAARRPRRTSF
jgi:hypothetical protein